MVIVLPSSNLRLGSAGSGFASVVGDSPGARPSCACGTSSAHVGHELVQSAEVEDAAAGHGWQAVTLGRCLPSQLPFVKLLVRTSGQYGHDGHPPQAREKSESAKQLYHNQGAKSMLDLAASSSSRRSTAAVGARQELYWSQRSDETQNRVITRKKSLIALVPVKRPARGRVLYCLYPSSFSNSAARCMKCRQ